MWTTTPQQKTSPAPSERLFDGTFRRVCLPLRGSQCRFTRDSPAFAHWDATITSGTPRSRKCLAPTNLSAISPGFRSTIPFVLSHVQLHEPVRSDHHRPCGFRQPNLESWRIYLLGYSGLSEENCPPDRSVLSTSLTGTSRSGLCNFPLPLVMPLSHYVQLDT